MVKEVANSHDASPKSSSALKLITEAVSEMSFSIQPARITDSPNPSGAELQTSRVSILSNQLEPTDRSVSPQYETMLETFKDRAVKTFSFSPEGKDMASKLNPELKTTLEQASQLTVKMPRGDTTGSDLVIKQDGTIVHYLNLDQKKNGVGNLIVSIESTIATDGELTTEQKESL
ncbi:MAG: hypothetical protein SGJ27_29650 [Candidatus Melainabacteria bacterium]|nr:hypothetical protein [Candidatus Melainabacteria bacterium]